LALFDPEPVLVPSPPVGHGITLSSEEFSRLPEEETTAEIRQMAARETAAWKFTLDFSCCRVKAALRYCLALSSIRRVEPVCGPVRSVTFRGSQFSGARLSDVNRRRRLEREAFEQPREVGVRSVAIPDRLLFDQDSLLRESEPPPAYECGWSECQTARNVVGPAMDDKK